MKGPSLLDLDKGQWAVVDLPFHENHVITGTAGSGKTVMAVYRAWILATAGRDVTLLTRSNLLHQYLAQLGPDLTEGFSVTTYHRWLRTFWHIHFKTDVPSADEEGWSFDWTEMQGTCILQRVRSTTHLVIDEGQNLPLEFYQLCRILGIGVTVFADECQIIGDEQSAVAEVGRALTTRSAPLVLSENYRNSREIAMLAAEFRIGAPDGSSLPTRSGRLASISKFSSLGSLATEVHRYFSEHPDRSIGIICRSTRLQREIQSHLTSRGLFRHTEAYVHDDQYRNTIDFSRRSIRIVHAASMKGLEFDGVFVPDLDAYTEDPTSVEARLRFLVLCTRAREDLHFAYRSTQEPHIVSKIPESLLSRV